MERLKALGREAFEKYLERMAEKNWNTFGTRY